MDERVERRSLGAVSDGSDGREDVKITYKWEEDQSPSFITVFTYGLWIVLLVIFLKIVF